MKTALIFVLLAFTQSAYAESKNASRGPASVNLSAKKKYHMSQAEQLLNQVKDPSPSFMRSTGNTGPVRIVGVCQSADGGLYSSTHQGSYAECMGSNYRRNTGALVFGR